MTTKLVAQRLQNERRGRLQNRCSATREAAALTTGEQARFLALQRQWSRQQKGSARRRATLDRLAVLRRRLQDRCTNWVE
ncbi:MAG: hypothetical protein WCG47_12895, partial [Dermatophilaceae bacterium]